VRAAPRVVVLVLLAEARERVGQVLADRAVVSPVAVVPVVAALVDPVAVALVDPAVASLVVALVDPVAALVDPVAVAFLISVGLAAQIQRGRRAEAPRVPILRIFRIPRPIRVISMGIGITTIISIFRSRRSPMTRTVRCRSMNWARRSWTGASNRFGIRRLMSTRRRSAIPWGNPGRWI
jgi:hypothetical protein